MLRQSDLKLLGLSVSSTKEEAKDAWRKFAMKHHPDRGGSGVIFAELQAACDRVIPHLAGEVKCKTCSDSGSVMFGAVKLVCKDCK
jgi:DnaJ-class molecular chaperone